MKWFELCDWSKFTFVNATANKKIAHLFTLHLFFT